MKIEFQNSVRRLSFLGPSTRHQSCLDKCLLRECLLIKRVKPVLNRTIKLFPLETFDQNDSFSCDCQGFFNIDRFMLGYV